ncbi:BLUF domain-containing protein [Mesorhizobium sp. Root695]|uniref:BLUF domain-containing protein n=1 Tax=Mesorhizobium sp. Root695 TaxID=1736589 RepID=UPI0039B74053
MDQLFISPSRPAQLTATWALANLSSETSILPCRFRQRYEGSSEAVDRLSASIHRDDRHQGVVQIVRHRKIVARGMGNDSAQHG